MVSPFFIILIKDKSSAFQLRVSCEYIYSDRILSQFVRLMLTNIATAIGIQTDDDAIEKRILLNVRI